jgi:hypothetical protein
MDDRGPAVAVNPVENGSLGHGGGVVPERAVQAVGLAWVPFQQGVDGTLPRA